MLTVCSLFFSGPQVAHMTKSEMHLHDLAFLGPGLLFLDQYFNSFIDEYLVLWLALVSTRGTTASRLVPYSAHCWLLTFFLSSTARFDV